MSKELPYFRFTVQDWQNGKISLETYELQGLFISICGYYWINDCSITLVMLQKKFRDAKNLIDELIKLDIIKHEKKHDKIEIEFLNFQYDLLSEKRKLRQIAGSKGGNAKAMLKQKGSYKDKDKDKDKDKIDYKKLLDFFNSVTGKKTKVVTDKVKSQIKARLSEGFTKEDIANAIKICTEDTFHKENDFKYLTLEFITRPDKLERYCDKAPKLTTIVA